jgi:hypothetical protein
MTLAQMDTIRHPELIPARQDTDSWVEVVRDVTLLAQQIAGTEFVPKGIRNSIPATAAAMLYGREVGLPPMTALSQIHVVDGRPGMSAEAMRALVLAAGHEIVFDETTSGICRVRGRRRNAEEWTPIEWSIDMARGANLLRRGSAWEFYPRDMLIARATTALCRLLFPDVIHGFRSVEELGDMERSGVEGGAGQGQEIATPRKRSTRSVSRRPRKQAEADTLEAESATAPPVESESTKDDDATAPRPRRLPSLPEEDEKRSEPGEETGQRNAAPPAPPVPTIAEEQAADSGSERINTVTLRVIFGQLRRLGIKDKSAEERENRLSILARLVERSELDSANDLTQEEGKTLTMILSTVKDLETLDEILASTTILPIGEVIAVEETEQSTQDDEDQLPLPLPGIDGAT